MLPIKPVMRLKTNLKLLMDAKGLRASQVARLSGVPSQRISDWTAGATVRNLDQLKKVCEVLGVSLDAILFAENPSTNDHTATSHVDLGVEQVFEVKIRRINKG